jgi:4-hydroxy-3-polyprenylbenzoate decarboxylase
MRRVVVGISGASGIIYGIRLLQALRQLPEVEIHLIMTRSAGVTLRLENPEWELSQVGALAHHWHREGDIAACIASGSYRVDAMVVAPCSMKTLAALACGLSDNLLTRAADVMLKERRRLVVVPRETPLSSIHLQNMLTLTQAGAIIAPPMPGFYHHPTSVGDVVDHTVGKVLDLIGFEQQLFPPWTGASRSRVARDDRASLESL